MSDAEQIDNLIKTNIKVLKKEFPNANAANCIDNFRKLFLAKTRIEKIELLEQIATNDSLSSYSLFSFENALKKCDLIKKIELLANGMFYFGMVETKVNFKAKILSEIGKKGASARLDLDPKQIAKKEIEVHYQAVKSQFKRRGYSAQFIREMHRSYPIIESQKTIENLVSALNKENELIIR